MQRTIEGQAKRGDPLVVVVMMMRVRFGMQPAGDVRDFRCRIEEAGIENCARIDRAVLRRDDRRTSPGRR